MEPIVVDLPLRGEWMAPNTPGHIIPSHGTDLLAQTYAYDFLQINWRYPKRMWYFEKPYFTVLLIGVRLNECMCWSQPVYAPFSGDIVESLDGIKERNPVHFVREQYEVLKNLILFKKNRISDLNMLLGNHIIIRGNHCFALFAHLRTNSINVKLGDTVKIGKKIAEVGHSGNSTAPHLHFQLMDNLSLNSAKGLPCCFREYEVFENGVWRKVINGIPRRYDRIRVN
jgi:hypothetical protein